MPLLRARAVPAGGGCPFCGADLRGGSSSVRPPGGGSGPRVVMVIAALVVVLAGGLLAYLAWDASPAGETGVGRRAASPEGEVAGTADRCMSVLEGVAAAQEEHLDRRGRFAVSLGELAAFDGSLETVCPSGSGLLMEAGSDRYSVTCPVHGQGLERRL